MTRALDPFRAGPDVDAYVRHPDREQSCEYLSAKLVEAPVWVGISGPSGVGKTLLARVLLRRLAKQFTIVHVPASDLAPAETERWMLAQLGVGDRTLAALATRLARAGRPLLAAIDEAQRASPELIAWLGTWCTPEVGGRAVLVWSEGDGARAPAALSRCVARVFVEPLALGEVPAYVEALLERAGASAEQRAVLAGHTLERLALASRGNHREIQRLADAELAAHAWRARTQPLRIREPAPSEARATASAPRSERSVKAASAPQRWRPRAVALAAGAAVALAALAFAILRRLL
jgi:hypothetical protein